MKTLVAELVERVNPHWNLKTKLRIAAAAVYDATDPVRVSIYRQIHRDVPAVPPSRNRRRVGSQGIDRFMEAGLNCYRPLRTVMDRYSRPPTPRPLRVLDFGCGVGRILQYFARDAVELHGSDVDSTAIEYLRQAFPSVRSNVNYYEPPLPYESGHFDVVYSASIWTHLTPSLQIPWLLELERVLAPGGLALVTTIGPYGYCRGTHLWDVTFTLDELLRDGYRYSEYSGQDDASVGPSYGAGYHTPEYVTREWGKYFDVLEVQEGVMDDLNDLVVLRKRHELPPTR